MTMGTTCAGRDRTDVEKMSINSLQRLLSCFWSHGEPETLIMTFDLIWHLRVHSVGIDFELILLSIDVIVVRNRVQ